MKTIRTILAATDFSFFAHRAARRAGMLAKEHYAELHLMHVVESSPIKDVLRRNLNVGKPLALDAERAIKSLADDVAQATGSISSGFIKEGSVLTELRTAANTADLIVLGPRGVNPLRDLFLGSTSERVARMIERPMLVVKQDPQIAYDTVLVPVDFSDYSLPAIQFARSLAPGATLQVFHTVQGVLEKTLRTAGVSEEAVAGYLDQLKREATADMAELLKHVDNSKVVGKVEAGDARSSIVESASALGCSLIVMGKQGRSWLSEHLLGSVSRYVLEHAACDVAVVPHP